MDKDKDTDKKVLVLSSEVVSRLTSSLSIDVILSNQARVFRALSSPSSEDGGMQLQCPTRTALTTDASTLLFMPGLLGSQTSVKCVSVPRTSRTGIPGTTLVFDADTGRVRAFVNASELTALRTAAGSVLATRAAKPDRHSVRHVALFGGGLQAFFHAWLLARVYPRSLTKITLFLTRGNTPSPTAQHTIDRLKACLGPGVHVEYTHDIERRLSEADVICCCTPAESPLFPAHCVRDGAHLNLVGSYKPHMQEVEPELIQQAAAAGALLVDSVDACSHEAGDLLQARVPSSQWRELGSVLPVEGGDPSPLTPGPVRASVFKSVGVGVQDVAVTWMVVQAAEAAGVGERVDYF